VPVPSRLGPESTRPSKREGAATAREREASATTGRPIDAREEVIDLLRVARKQLEDAQADGEVPYRERAQLITSCTGLCRLLARLSGQLEVTETAIVRSAHWARAMRLVREVLAKHPAAAADLDAALERFTHGGTET
jgi:recombinational DNA repair protein RecT